MSHADISWLRLAEFVAPIVEVFMLKWIVERYVLFIGRFAALSSYFIEARISWLIDSNWRRDAVIGVNTVSQVEDVGI